MEEKVGCKIEDYEVLINFLQVGGALTCYSKKDGKSLELVDEYDYAEYYQRLVENEKDGRFSGCGTMDEFLRALTLESLQNYGFSESQAEVLWNWDGANPLSERPFKLEKKIKVQYECGEGRHTQDSVDFLIGLDSKYGGLLYFSDGEEFYAEIPIEEGEYTDEQDKLHYRLLKEKMVQLAEEHGFLKEDFEFWWD